MANEKLVIPGWMKLYTLIDDKPILTVANSIGMTSSHAYGIIKRLEEQKWIKTEHVGRKVQVTFTEKGNKQLKIIKSLIKNIE